jgi:hypothetical protein
LADPDAQGEDFIMNFRSRILPSLLAALTFLAAAVALPAGTAWAQG